MSTISEFVKASIIESDAKNELPLIPSPTSSIETIRELPLMHSCDSFRARQIIDDEALKVKECPVFGEKLLYFFYGKPAYPVSERVEMNRTDVEYLPVCFIVPFDKVSHYRIFPFDTGAYDAGMYYKAHLHHEMHIDEFELDNSLDGLMHYIKVFYKNNDGYIHGKPSDEIKETDDPYIDGLINMHNATGEETLDERMNAVEVIVNKDVGIKDGVECIIMPATLLRSKKIQAFMNAHKEIECRTYDVRSLISPSQYAGVVYQKAMDYMREKDIVI